MIDIVVEALLDDNLAQMLTLADDSDDATRCCFHHLAQHAVLDADRSLILQEDNLVTGCKVAVAIGGLEHKSLLDDAALHQRGARQFIQHADVTAKVRQDQCRLGRIVVAVPIGDEVGDRIGLQL